MLGGEDGPAEEEEEDEETPRLRETAGGVAAAPGHVLRGSEEEVGPAQVYTCRPAAPRGGGASTDCVIVVHDVNGFQCSRHRQLTDALATQGWLAVLPDFAPSSSDRGRWFEDMKTYCVDYLLPWLEEEGVQVVQCLGLGSGAIPCAHVAAGEVLHLKNGVVPFIAGMVLAYPNFPKPYVLNDGELQKMVALLPPKPLLVMPTEGGMPETRMGGLLDAQRRIMQRPIEFMTFAQAQPGFMVSGSLEEEETRLAAAWGADAASEFLHQNFALAERPKIEPPAKNSSDED